MKVWQKQKKKPERSQPGMIPWTLSKCGWGVFCLAREFHFWSLFWLSHLFDFFVNSFVLLQYTPISYVSCKKFPSVYRKEICSISSRSRVLAHRPCPKLEMFCPSVPQLFYGCNKVLMTNHGMSFFFFSNRLEIRAQLPYFHSFTKFRFARREKYSVEQILESKPWLTRELLKVRVNLNKPEHQQQKISCITCMQITAERKFRMEFNVVRIPVLQNFNINSIMTFNEWTRGTVLNTYPEVK